MTIPSQLIQHFESANLSAVESYVKSNPDLLKEKELLGRAVRHGNLEIVKKLHQLGANDTQNALGYIVYGQKKDIAEYLVDNGGEMMKQGFGDPVPVGACEVLNSFALKLAIELSPHGLPYLIGRACLAMVLSTYSRNPKEKHACLKILEKNGVKIPNTIIMKFHKGDLEGLKKAIQEDKSLLHRLFDESEIYPSEFGINSGDGLHLTPLDGSSLLHLAVEYHELEILQMLLEEGADPNIQSSVNEEGFGGHTPLFHTVVSYSYLDEKRAQLLLQFGADKNIKASIKKELRYMGNPELEKPMIFQDVTAMEYAAQFPLKYWVSESSVRLITLSTSD